MSTLTNREIVRKTARTYWLNVILMLTLIVIGPQTYISFYKISQLQVFVIELIILSIFLFQKKKIKINNLQLVTLLMFMILLLSNKLFTGDSLAFSLVLATTILIMFVFTQIITYEEFVGYYTTAMVLLCLYSVISTYTIIVFVDFFNGVLPSFTHSLFNMRFLDAGLCFVYIPQYGGMQFRNYSVFSEPGVYQFYINLALIFELWFKNDNKYKKTRITVLVVTLITTFSVPGIIVGLLTICLFFTKRKAGIEGENKIKWLFFVLVLLTSACYIGIPSFTSIVERLLSKLSGGDSLDSRAGSLFAYFYAWLDKPFVGWGYEAGVSEAGAKYLSKYTAHNTNTIFTNLAFYGVIYGGLYLILFWKFILNIRAPIITRIILFIAMMISLNNERFIDNGIVFIILFYAVTYSKEREDGKWSVKKP